MIIRRSLLAVVAMFAMVFGINAAAANAAPAFTGPTFQLETSSDLDPYAAQAATLWNKTGLVKVNLVDSCAGPGCIHSELASIGYAGLATRNEDGSYLAQVATWIPSYGTDAIVHTLAHESGHGIIHSVGGGWWHAEGVRDLMYYSYNGDGIGRITPETKNYLSSFINGTAVRKNAKTGAQSTADRFLTPAPVVTVSVESKTLGKFVNTAVRDLNAATNVELKTGACAGPLCVHVVQVETTVCGPAGGCSSALPDGSCLVEVSNDAVARGRAMTYVVTAHEIGHCLKLGHNEVQTSIMYWMADGTQKVTPLDIANVDAAWRDYALAA